VAAGVRQVDRADQRDGHQQNDSSEKNDYDHNILLKFGKMKCIPSAKGTSFVVNKLRGGKCKGVAERGQLWAGVYATRVLELGRQTGSRFPALGEVC
jgi:hypothetical protein